MLRNLKGNETITVLTRVNPKKPASGAHQRFRLYEDGLTVQEYQERVGDSSRAKRDLRWDARQKFIRVQRPKNSATLSG
jgi:hypothetical protein